MPAEFRKMGISFQYPDNWTLDEEEAVTGNQSVTVYSSGGALWTLSVHPRSADPGRLAEAAVAAMKEEYEGLDVEEKRESLAGHELVGYDLGFFCLDLTNTATVRCLRTDRGTYSIFCEADDREFDRVRTVFEAMTISFLRDLDRPAQQ